MDFGTAVHDSIELFRCRKPNRYVTIEVAIFFFKERFRWLHQTNGPKYKTKDLEIPIDFFLKAGDNILSRFHECDELREAEVLYNEHPLYVPIDRDDMDLKFKGFIDMVIRTKDKRGNTILYVLDFKTCSWGWDRDKRQDKAVHFQILLYKHFLCKKFNLDPKMVRCAFVLLKKRPRKDDHPVEWFPISAGPVSVQRAVDELNMDMTEIARRELTGNFKKDRNQCVNSFGDTCPYLRTEQCPEG